MAEQLAHVPVEVTLIDQHDYHTFQPLLYQVATSLLHAEDVGAPIRGLFRRQTICVSTLKKSLSGVELKYVSHLDLGCRCSGQPTGGFTRIAARPRRNVRVIR